MTLPIIEQPLLGQIQLETARWVTPFVWVDRTPDLAGGFTYSEGAQTRSAGSPIVDVGSLMAALKDVTDVPLVGDLVRLRLQGASTYIFTGYIQDVSQTVVYDNSVSLNTPITLTSIMCLDWVGYISQFNIVGAGGCDVATGAEITDSYYRWHDRVAALNKAIDSTYATKILSPGAYASNDKLAIGDTDLVAPISSHLDLISHTCGIIWRGEHKIPTNKTTGRTGLIKVKLGTNYTHTFTDEIGTGTELHYTELDFQNSTQNVANTIVVNNRVRLNVPDEEVTVIGGFNEENFVVVNNENVVGIALERTEKKSDATSIDTYGERDAQIDTNAAVSFSGGGVNLISNPSVEYSDDGYTGDSNIRARRRKPSEDNITPFDAFNGSWAIRSRQRVANNAAVVSFSGGESDGIPVIEGTTYYLSARAARGTASRTNARFGLEINWYDDNESVISTTSSGTLVTLTTENTWYLNTVSGAAPTGAVRATVAVRFTRPGTQQHSVGDRLWVDALRFAKDSGTTYFDGDTPWDEFYGYAWTGGVSESPSYKFTNSVDQAAEGLLFRFSTTSMKVARMRWNAQEDMSVVPLLQVGETIRIKYRGVTSDYRITGIDGQVDQDRYMIDYYLRDFALAV